MARENAKKKPGQAIAIVALLLNVLILPGLGSIVGGRNMAGIYQLSLLVGGMVLFAVGIPLSMVLIGLSLVAAGGVMAIAAWVWGVVTGVQLIRESE